MKKTIVIVNSENSSININRYYQLAHDIMRKTNFIKIIDNTDFDKFVFTYKKTKVGWEYTYFLNGERMLKNTLFSTHSDVFWVLQTFLTNQVSYKIYSGPDIKILSNKYTVEIFVEE